MPDCNTRRPEDWYRKSGYPELKKAGSWYGDASELVTPRLADAGCSTHQPPPRAVSFEGDMAKKRRRTKIISLSVCACLLVAAMTVAAWQIAGLFRGRAAVEAAAVPSGEMFGFSTGEEQEYYEDFREYFANYYVGEPGVNMPRGEIGTGVTVKLWPLSESDLPLQEIYEAVSPAVVGVTTYLEGQEYSQGTGVVFTADGYIITNTHVLSGGDTATVVFSDGAEYEAEVIGADEVSDIAVLHIQGEDLPYARFGDSSGLQVGDAVVAIGNPLGQAYSGTMTNGIISAINRNISYNGHSMTLLQTNAALNEGNSGGPLVNAAGQIVGITNMKIMSTYYATVEGIGFAIPSAVVKQVADELIEKGIVMGEPTIGIVAGSVNAEAMELYGMPEGVYISEVNEGSDAKEQGVRVGDVILEVNGIPVTTVAEVNLIKEGMQVGDALELTIWRDGNTLEITVRLVDRSVIQ